MNNDNLPTDSVQPPLDSAPLPPDMGYWYFRNAERYQFKAGARGFSFRNAWWLCEASYLAYCHPGFARMAFELAGFRNFRFFTGKVADCMLVWSRRAVIVAFRGTEMQSSSTFRELLADINAVPADFEMGGKVHQGFLHALNEIWPGEEGLAAHLDELVREKKRRPLWFTGHSLGGALAALAFSRRPEAKALYQFGAPRVGDMGFTDLLRGREVYRIEYGRDPIPLVPPDLSRIGFEFRDGGTLVYLHRDGRLLNARPSFDDAAHSEELRSYMREKRELGKRLGRKARRRIRGLQSLAPVWKEAGEQLRQISKDWKEYVQEFDDDFGISIDDHMPMHYCVRLWNEMVGGKP